MKSILILLFLVLQGVSLLGQQTDTLYFKDKWKSKEASQKKAKYFEVRTVIGGVKKQTLYSVNGKDIISHQEYKGDLPAGVWTDNRYQGRTRTLDYSFELKYSDTKIQGGIYPGQENNTNIEKATFPGGAEAFYQYVGKTMRYPVYARRNGIQGKVHIHIKVTKDGNVQFLSIYKGVNKFLDQEAARVLVQSPDWIPARNNGEPIDSYYIIPLTFKLA